MRIFAVLGALVTSAAAPLAQEADAPRRHPYLERALERLAFHDDLGYSAEAVLSEEIAGTVTEVEGRVVLRRQGARRSVAIDATVTVGEREVGVSFRSRGDGWRVADHGRRVWTEGDHEDVLGPEAALALALLAPGIAETAPLEVVADRLVFRASETFQTEACHRFVDADEGSTFLFAASDGLPRLVSDRRWVGGAERRARRWRMLAWNPRPRYFVDPFALPDLEGYERVEPGPRVVPARDARPVHALEESLAPLVEAMHASEARVLVVASVSPT